MERLPGFRDFFPEPVPHSDAWSMGLRTHVHQHWRSTARRCGFKEFDGPPLEPLELYTRKSGDEIVMQLFNFTDKGEREVSLRPEMTPTLARMIAAHQRNYKKPIKWYSIPQLFRYEKQQKGRLREHFQLNADIVGESDPAADAELIALLIDVLRDLGLTHEDLVVRISSRDAWQEFFNRRCSEPEKAYDFFQIIDKLERESPEESSKKLENLGFALSEVLDFIAEGQPTSELNTVIANLEARGLADFIKIDYNIIRGLAYYTGIVFEAFDRKGEFRAIAGGGRYDNLISLMSDGKVDLPALGFGMGDVVLTELLSARGLIPEQRSPIDVYCMIEDESLRAASLNAVQQLREHGQVVEYPLTPTKSNKQFKLAKEFNARSTVRVVEANDSSPGVVVVKDFGTQEEEKLRFEALLDRLKT